MVRAPCCEKMGLKRGPWSPEEDHILVTYINLHGHSNWRALPKQAGLLRCGKSCRLRWTNYLKPDIKRGNFSLEEEQTIIELHQQLGNRWSAIAAKLPGRTDNEIKNVWHTHLKKRLQKPPKAASETETTSANFDDEESRDLSTPTSEASESPTHPSSAVSLQTSSSSEDDIMSSMTTVSDNNNNNNNSNYNSFCITNDELPEEFPGMDEEFWSEVLSADTSDTAAEPSAAATGQSDFACFDEIFTMEEVSSVDGQSMSMNMSMSMWEGVEFWHDLFTKAGEFPEFSEF